MKRKISMLVILCLLVTVLGACAKSAGSSAEPAGKNTDQAQTFVIASRAIAKSLDPVKDFSYYLINVGAGELLFRIGEDGQLKPSLAENLQQIDSNTWEITLRPEATFWSGAAVDATAVIASLERSRSLDARAQSFLEGMTFETAGSHKIKVNTTRKNMEVGYSLAHYQLIIHNADMDYKTIETTDFTGMYKIKEYVPEQRLVVELNETYYGKKPSISRVVNEQISDEQSRVLAAQSGRYHVVMHIPTTSVSQIKKDQSLKIISEPVANTQTVYFNLNKPQFQDVKVRQALSWAVNRDELSALGSEGFGVTTTTWLGSNPLYPEAKNLIYDRHNLDMAAGLLDDAGWKLGDDQMRYKDGQPLEIHLRTWGVDKALGEGLQSQWSKLGVRVNVTHGDYNLIQTARETGEWDATIEAWTTFGDVVSLLKAQYAPGGGGNYGGYNNPDITALFEQIDKADTADARRALVLALSKQVAEQAPVVCLYSRPELTAVKASVEGFTPHFRQFENVVHSGLSIKE